VVVVRKGATPAFPGQKGFVGGSMGDDAVIVQGTRAENDKLSELQRDALFSTVHGAGRVMSRSAAAGKINRRTGKVIKPGAISPRRRARSKSSTRSVRSSSSWRGRTCSIRTRTEHVNWRLTRYD